MVQEEIGTRPLAYYVMMWRKTVITRSRIRAFKQRSFLAHNAILHNRIRRKGL